MSPDFYHTIEKNTVAEFKDRGSKFIAYCFPISSTDDFKSKLADIKKEHPKATHHCFAYRLGVEGNNFRASDDGEPSGSAGKPILGQIDNKELTNLLIVVVRYFGGTQLGIPGLINAYKTSASLALQLSPMIKRPVMHYYQLQFDYTLMNVVMTILRQFACEVLEQEMTLFCRIRVAIPQNKLTECTEKLKEVYGLETDQIKSA